MKINMYALFDSAAKAYISPFFLAEDGQALRTFSDNVNSDHENNISRHPDQFTLFKLGTYDDSNAKIETLDAPLSLANGLELVTEPQITIDQFNTLLTKIEALENK